MRKCCMQLTSLSVEHRSILSQVVTEEACLRPDVTTISHIQLVLALDARYQL